MIDKITYHRGVGEDLWKRVTAKGVMSQRFCLHLGKRVIDIRQKSSSLLKTEPSCLINRADLCSGSPIRNLSSPPLSVSFSPLCMIPRPPEHYSRFAAPGRPNQTFIQSSKLLGVCDTISPHLTLHSTLQRC